MNEKMKATIRNQNEKENIIPMTQGFPAGRSRCSRGSKTSTNTPIIHSSNQNYLYDQQMQQFREQLNQLKQQEQMTSDQQLNEDNSKSFVRYPKSSRGEQPSSNSHHYHNHHQINNARDNAISDIKDLKQLKCFLLENDLDEETIQSKEIGEQHSYTITHPSQYSEKNQSETSYFREKLPPFKDGSTSILQKMNTNQSQLTCSIPTKNSLASRQKSANNNNSNHPKELRERNNIQSKPPSRQDGCNKENNNEISSYQTISHNDLSSRQCTCSTNSDLHNKTQSAFQEKNMNINSFREIVFCQHHSNMSKNIPPLGNNSSHNYSNSRRPLVQKSLNSQQNTKSFQKQFQENDQPPINSKRDNDVQQKRTSQWKKRDNSSSQQQSGSNSLEISLFQYLQNPINNNQNIILSNEFGRMHSKSVFSVSKDGYSSSISQNNNLNNNNSNLAQSNCKTKYVAQQSEERKNFNKTIHNALLNFKAMQQTQGTLPPMNSGIQNQQMTVPIKQQLNPQKSGEINSSNNQAMDQQKQMQHTFNAPFHSNNLQNDQNIPTSNKITLPLIHKSNSKHGRSLSFNGVNATNKNNVTNSNQYNTNNNVNSVFNNQINLSEFQSYVQNFNSNNNNNNNPYKVFN